MSKIILTKEYLRDKNILDFVKKNLALPTEYSEYQQKKMIERLENQLVGKLIYPSQIPKLKTILEKKYRNSLIEAGESVGILCAQSIGEKNTQMTLNTFHSCGSAVKAVTSGVPKFQELLNVTKNPKIVNCKIYTKTNNSTIEQIRDHVSNKIKCVKIKNVIRSIEYIPKFDQDQKWINIYCMMNGKTIPEDKIVTKIILNTEKMFKLYINANMVAEKIENEFDDCTCIVSPPQLETIYIVVENSTLTNSEKNWKTEKLFVDQCLIEEIGNIQVSGIEGIDKIYFTKENDGWFVETEGTNLPKILAHPDIDSERSVSNNIWEIYQSLGIEATYQFLMEEFGDIMTGINVCHTQMLVSRMTYSGTISSISRYTLKKEDSGPFCKASFEESMENFIRAGAYGEVEPVKGVSSSIICGKRARIGTGMVSLKFDTKMKKNDTLIENFDNLKISNDKRSCEENIQNSQRKALKKFFPTF